MSRKAKSTHSILDGVDLRTPECKGYLFKQSKTHRAYNKRYFALYKKLLVYYESEEEWTHDVGRSTLEHRHSAILLEGLYLTKPETKPSGARYCFILHAPHKSNERKEILLVAHTKDDRKMWMDKLQDQNKHLVPLSKKKASATAKATAQPKIVAAPKSQSYPKPVEKPVAAVAKDQPKAVDKASEAKDEPRTAGGETKQEATAQEPKPSEPSEAEKEEPPTVRHIIPAESDVSFSTDKDTSPQHLEVVIEYSDSEENPIQF